LKRLSLAMLPVAVFFAVRWVQSWRAEQQRHFRTLDGRVIRVLVLGTGAGGATAALALKDSLGCSADVHLVGCGEIGGRCATIELAGETYECGASIASDLNVYFCTYMRRFGLERKMGLQRLWHPLGIFDGNSFIFRSTKATTWGWRRWLAKVCTAGRVVSRYGLFEMIRLRRLVSSSAIAPKFSRVYAELGRGGAYASGAELLHGLGASELVAQSAEAVFLSAGVSPRVTAELIQPGMRANYAGQSVRDLHGFATAKLLGTHRVLRVPAP
jgi:hypothetical protein